MERLNGVAGGDLFGQLDVAAQHAVQRLADLRFGQAAHAGDLGGDLAKLLVERSDDVVAHLFTLIRSGR